MRSIRIIAAIMLWLSISLAGGNAYAHDEHDVTAGTHSIAVHGKHTGNLIKAIESDCRHKGDSHQHPTGPTKCCATCTPGMAVPSNPLLIPPCIVKSEQVSATEHVLLASPPESQERPPKSLS